MKSLRPLLVLSLAPLLLVGCVKRMILVESDPPGAKVWINEHPAGVTPVKQEFITHGRYKFRLRKNGFREVVAKEMVRAPLYEWMPFDFFFENVLPIHLDDKHRFLYKLTPETPSERLQEEAPADAQADLQGLHDKDPEKRRAACMNLARRRDPATGSQALEATRDPSPIVRKAALQAARPLTGAACMPRLIELLSGDPSPEVRWQAAVELEALKDKAAVPPLIQALKDKDPLVRAGAAEALKGIPDPRAVRSLILSLRDKDTTVRRSSAEGLGLIGDRSAVRPLTRVLFFHDFQARRRAAKSLAQLGDPAAAVPLAHTLDSWDPRLRKISSQAIIQMGDPRPVPLLIRYLHSWKSVTREEAAIALGGLKDQRAVEPLVRAFRREPNHVTSRAMLAALKSLGAQVDPTWEQLDTYRAKRAEWTQKQQKKQEPRKKLQ